jgi:hypothetical protein
MKGDLLDECEEIVGDWTPPKRVRHINSPQINSMLFGIAEKHGGVEFDHMIAESMGDYSHWEDDY